MHWELERIARQNKPEDIYIELVNKLETIYITIKEKRIRIWIIGSNYERDER
jgi:hypothetical protein